MSLNLTLRQSSKTSSLLMTTTELSRYLNSSAPDPVAHVTFQSITICPAEGKDGSEEVLYAEVLLSLPGSGQTRQHDNLFVILACQMQN